MNIKKIDSRFLKNIPFKVRVYHANCIISKNLHEILMGCGRSFQQKVALLSLIETLKEANLGADKANHLLRLSPTCPDAAVALDNSFWWTHRCPLGMHQSLYLIPQV